MSASNTDFSAVERFTEAAIRENIGDVSSLPENLVAHIRQVYLEFMSAYIPLLRQKHQRSSDWFPEAGSIDTALADEMRHFFSDYQHITKAFFTLKARISRLQRIDREARPHMFRQAVDDMLQPNGLPLDPGE
jgi:hypothetical protein